MLRTLGLFSLLITSFGAGYHLGSKGTGTLPQRLSELREEMTVKTQILQEEVSAARVRMNLLEARDRLIQAERKLGERNFGEAEESLGEAEVRLSKASELAKGTRRSPLIHRLEPISATLRETRHAVRDLNPQAHQKVVNLAEALQEVMDASRL